MALWASMAQTRQDRSRSPVRNGVNACRPSSSSSSSVRAAADLPGISSVQDIFCLPSHMVSRMSGELGNGRVLQALGRLKNSSLTTMFSGCGLCEIWVEALASQAGVKVNLGSALDWEPTAQAVLSSRWPQRCIFGDVMDQVKGLRQGKKKPTCKALASTCFCFTHQKQCSTALQFKPIGSGLEILVAGACCPPWSAFGNGAGTDDPRYESHEAQWANLNAQFFFSGKKTGFEARHVSNYFSKPIDMFPSEAAHDLSPQVSPRRCWPESVKLHQMCWSLRTWIAIQGSCWLMHCLTCLRCCRPS